MTPTKTTTPTKTITPTGTPFLQAQITTDRGCIETGNTPVFAVGETVTVFFEMHGQAGGMLIQEAHATIFDFVDGNPNGSIDFGVQPTDTTLIYQASVVPPTGTETLVLMAETTQPPLVAQAQCSFEVTEPTPCMTACDCSPGLRCDESICTMGPNPVYCCTGMVCPTDETCQFPAGNFSLCP